MSFAVSPSGGASKRDQGFTRRATEKELSTSSPCGQQLYSSPKTTFQREQTAHWCGAALAPKRRDDAPAGRGDNVVGQSDPEHRLTSERLRQWGMYMHIDHVFDLVPFWRRGVDAAERGEELRLEEFLEKMEEDGGWRTVSDVWDLLGGPQKTPGTASDATEMCWNDQDQGWGIKEAWDVAEHGSEGRCMSEDKGWGIIESWAMAEHGSDEWGTTRGWTPEQDAQLAQAKAISQNRYPDGAQDDVGGFVDKVARQRAVSEEHRKQMHRFFQMPTEQKIQEIQEIIRFLRTHH
ncbi:hypothetical protein V8B97DRAFT_623552 [Scleroderma yunnanense]